jgi:hypothetical protein
VPPRAHRWHCRRTSCSSRRNDITVRQQGLGLNAGTTRVMVSWPGLALAGCWPPAPGESRQSGPRRGHAPMDCRSEAAYELTCLKIRQTMWYRSRSQSVAWKPAPGPRGVAPWLSASTFTHIRRWSPRIPGRALPGSRARRCGQESTSADRTLLGGNGGPGACSDSPGS